MSRFANLDNRKPIKADCRCDGKPHAEDVVEILTELPYGAEAVLSNAGYARNPQIFNFHDARLKLLELGVMSWNLLGPNGQPWEVSATTISLLDKETATWIAEELNAEFQKRKPLPNRHAGRSRNGSSGTSSPTRETPARQSSTTSS